MLLKIHCVLVPLVVLCAVGCPGTLADEVNAVPDLRQWAADVIRGDITKTPESRTTGDSGEETPASIYKTFTEKVQTLLYQAGQLVEQRIGWLRPTNVKEQALIWMAVALALPWGFISWLRPLLRHDIRPVRWIVVGIWASLARWSAWITWGAPSGADRFASTMLIGLPLLLMYFNCVARSVATSAKD